MCIFTEFNLIFVLIICTIFSELVICLLFHFFLKLCIVPTGKRAWCVLFPSYSEENSENASHSAKTTRYCYSPVFGGIIHWGHVPFRYGSFPVVCSWQIRLDVDAGREKIRFWSMGSHLVQPKHSVCAFTGWFVLGCHA